MWYRSSFLNINNLDSKAQNQKGLRNNWFISIKHSIYLVEEERLLKMISRILLGVAQAFLLPNYLLQFNLYQKDQSNDWDTHRENGECSIELHRETVSRLSAWSVIKNRLLTSSLTSTTFKYLYLVARKKKQHSKDVFKHFIKSEWFS